MACLQRASTTQHGGQFHCASVANKKHADDKNKTILMRQPHARFATAGWNPYCKCTVANTKDEDLYVGEQPLTAGCDRRCWLLFYGSGKGASVGERPTREHFLAVNGEKASVHSTARLRSLTWICIARCSNLSKDCLTWAASSELMDCTDSITKESSVFVVTVTRAS